MKSLTLTVSTSAERFYSITEQVSHGLTKLLTQYCKESSDGLLFIFIKHTSCALTISESYDPQAKIDLEETLKHLCPRDLPFITHTSEGPDDSPSHMKSMLLNQHLAIPVEKGKLELGTWQGIFLAEFRDAPHQRQLGLKFFSD